MWTFLVTLCCGGCGRSAKVLWGDDEERVKRMAAGWPAYQAPYLPGAQATSAPLERTSRVVGARPLLELNMPVVRPYQEWDLAQTAADSLGRIGAPAVPELIQTLTHPQAAQRLRAARVLARIGPDAKDAVPALIRTLEDSDMEVRKAAARALGQVGPEASAAVGPLMRVIEEGPQSTTRFR
jgi:HEAT repeat protein